MRATLMWVSVEVVVGVRIVQCHAIMNVVIGVRVMQYSGTAFQANRKAGQWSDRNRWHKLD